MIMTFLSAFQAMAGLSLLFAFGYGIARKGWITPEVEIFLPKFITGAAIPPFLAGNIITYFNHDKFFEMIFASLIPASSMIISFIVFRIIANIINIDKTHRGIFALSATASNTILIGIPVNMALFGEQALPHVLLYFFANSVMFWGFGSYILSKEGTYGKTKHSIKESIQRIFSPPVCGILVGIFILILGIPVPKVLLTACGYLGGMATPLALIFLGGTLHRIDWKNAHLGKDVLLGVICRLVAGPFVIVALLHFVKLPIEMSQVFIIQSSLPVVGNLPVLAAYYGADKEYASLLVSLTTLLGMMSVPFWMGIIQSLNLA